MAALIGGATASAAASVTENARNLSALLPLSRRHFVLQSNFASFLLTPRKFTSLFAEGGSSKAVASTSSKSENSSARAKDMNLSEEPSETTLASEELISQFLSQVASFAKLVDSKDITELQLKQPDCEVLKRKKEALPSPPSPPIQYYQSQPQPAPVSAPSTVPSAAPLPPKAQSSKSSHPPMKCPMAGTFYQSPGLGEPPFVKVGDKVKKGQVLCIIEAMKLMNEIEADQSGTIVDIIAEDGKPVSVDAPLFVIEP